jgi:hypothetical protein
MERDIRVLEINTRSASGRSQPPPPAALTRPSLFLLILRMMLDTFARKGFHVAYAWDAYAY